MWIRVTSVTGRSGRLLPASLLTPALAALLAITALPWQRATAFEMPPRNPWLANSSYAMGHGDSAQQDAVPQGGPMGPSRVLAPEELQYTFTGPGFFGINTSGVYRDSKRVFWGNGLDRLVKLDYDSYETIAEKFFPGVQHCTQAQSERAIATFDAGNSGIFALYNAYRAAQKLRNLSNLCTLLDSENTYYLGSNPEYQPYGVQKFA